MGQNGTRSLQSNVEEIELLLGGQIDGIMMLTKFSMQSHAGVLRKLMGLKGSIYLTQEGKNSLVTRLVGS